MKPAVQDAERHIVVAGDGNQCAVRTDAHVEPSEQPVLGHARRRDVAQQPVERPPHVLPRPQMSPPVLTVDFVAVALPHRIHMLLRMLERRLVERRLLSHHVPAEVHDPLVRRAPGHVHAVHPRPEHIRVGPTVRIRGLAEPFPGLLPRHVEGAALGVAHECDAEVPVQTLHPGQVDAGTTPPRRQVGVDRIHDLAIEPSFRRQR